MSEIRLEQKGFRIVSENGRRQVIEPKTVETFITAEWNSRSKMFELECEYYLQGESKISHIGVKRVKYDEHGNDLKTQLWHNRMGHFSKLPNICKTRGEVENCEG